MTLTINNKSEALVLHQLSWRQFQLNNFEKTIKINNYFDGFILSYF